MSKRLVSISVILSFCVLPPLAAASPLDDASLPGANRYDHCLALVKRNARQAESAADDWHKSGGGAPALHCDALALVALHRYADAALKLQQAAFAVQGNRDLAVALYDQAGNAWLLAGQPQKAEAAIGSALALAPDDNDLLFDRARARAAYANWRGAEADLSKLLASDPNRADAFVLRASARHAQGHTADASRDIARALEIYPDYPEALVERGAMEYESGDLAHARADWQLAAHDSPDSDAGAAARQHLADMDAPKPAKSPGQ